MNVTTPTPQSRAVIASWACLGLALACMAIFLLFQMVNQISPFEHTQQGVLTGFLPRTALYVAWAGEALAVVVGFVSFLLIRRGDKESKAILGIVARSLFGILVGLCGTVVLWLIVGHVVIGF